MANKTKAAGTVTSAEMQYKPVGFDSLNLDELHTIADYFGVDQAETITEQVANFAEEGVTYVQYAKAFKVPLPEDYQEEELPVVEEDEQEEPVVETGPVTAPREAQFAVQNEYLIKMTRDNPYFEVANLSNRRATYKFTTAHPYAVMDAKTAQFVLSHETGFRQAFPDELAEFYSE
ncbi:MAG TPA: hypothetical protein VIJ87_04665 [Pyrinomonadaceae bacterium]